MLELGSAGFVPAAFKGKAAAVSKTLTKPAMIADVSLRDLMDWRVAGPRVKIRLIIEGTRCSFVGLVSLLFARKKQRFGQRPRPMCPPATYECSAV